VGLEVLNVPRDLLARALWLYEGLEPVAVEEELAALAQAAR
jgi:hypothetical protein